MSAEVFISYAAKDRERVAKLVEGLESAARAQAGLKHTAVNCTVRRAVDRKEVTSAAQLQAPPLGAVGGPQ